MPDKMVLTNDPYCPKRIKAVFQWHASKILNILSGDVRQTLIVTSSESKYFLFRTTYTHVI